MGRWGWAGRRVGAFLLRGAAAACVGSMHPPAPAHRCHRLRLDTLLRLRPSPPNPPPASTDGLGLFEYLLLAEELGAEPIWVVNNGGWWQGCEQALPSRLAGAGSQAQSLQPRHCPACLARPPALRRHRAQRPGAAARRVELGAGAWAAAGRRVGARRGQASPLGRPARWPAQLGPAAPGAPHSLATPCTPSARLHPPTRPHRRRWTASSSSPALPTAGGAACARPWAAPSPGPSTTWPSGTRWAGGVEGAVGVVGVQAQPPALLASGRVRGPRAPSTAPARPPAGLRAALGPAQPLLQALVLAGALRAAAAAVGVRAASGCAAWLAAAGCSTASTHGCSLLPSPRLLTSRPIEPSSELRPVLWSPAGRAPAPAPHRQLPGAPQEQPPPPALPCPLDTCTHQQHRPPVPTPPRWATWRRWSCGNTT